MTEEQKVRLVNLVYDMPFLGGKTVSRSDFAEGLIANLEVLKEELENFVIRHEAMAERLQEYERAVAGLRFLLTVRTGEGRQ